MRVIIIAAILIASAAVGAASAQTYKNPYDRYADPYSKPGKNPYDRYRVPDNIEPPKDPMAMSSTSPRQVQRNVERYNEELANRYQKPASSARQPQRNPACNNPGVVC